jgi:hypothetical protein
MERNTSLSVTKWKNSIGDDGDKAMGVLALSGSELMSGGS